VEFGQIGEEWMNTTVGQRALAEMTVEKRVKKELIPTVHKTNSKERLSLMLINLATNKVKIL
jgi:hypothetical protein